MLLISTPFVYGTENAQLVQTNVNLQSAEQSNLEKSHPDPESPAVPSSVAAAVQQEVVAVNQDVPGVPQIKTNVASIQPQLQPQQSIVDLNNVQLLKEANAQYQYQINSRYEEKTRPVYSNDIAANSQQSQAGGYPYSAGPISTYPFYRENSQYQELGNGQRRADTTIMLNDGVKTQYENQDQSSYTHQRSQSFSEYGKGEASPEYNTYAYKQTYY